MLHGHLYIDPAPPWMEHVVVGGHAYILHPPLSAVVSIPFVLLGVRDPAIVSTFLGVLATLLVYSYTRSAWLTALYAFGTTMLYESTLGASWNFALVASTPFTLGAMLAGGDIGCGILGGLAALARYDLVLALPFYAWKRRSVWPLLAGLTLWLPVYVWFNYERFGVVYDPSLGLWYAQDSYRFVANHGTFSPYYIPLALYTVLFMAPKFANVWPYFRPQFMGQSLFSLSPAFALGVRWSSWFFCALVCSVPALTVWASGFSQLGSRYYVQVYPFVIASLDERGIDPTLKRLIVASIVLSMYFTYVAWVYGLSSP